MKKIILVSILIIVALITLSNAYASQNTTLPDDNAYYDDYSLDNFVFDYNETLRPYDYLPSIDEDFAINDNNISVDYRQRVDHNNEKEIWDNLENYNYLSGEYIDNSAKYPINYNPNNTYTNIVTDPAIFDIIEEDVRRENNKHCAEDLSIIQNDLVKIYGNGTKFKSTFYGKDDLRMKNETVFFMINGVQYSRKTNQYGQAFMNINLSPGNYTITSINPVLNTTKTSKVSVLPNMDNNRNIVKFYKNATQYTIRLLDLSGNPVANAKVTFNINGVFYERISNSTGYAKLNINLHPSTYIITAEYENCKISNNITVLPVLSAKDISMKYMDNTKFSVNLIDGQGNNLAGENVTFNINGVFYERTTDNQGIARLNIRLMPGQYIITSTYNGASVANTINIAENKKE